MKPNTLLYCINQEDEYCKIGISKNPSKRIRSLQRANPKKLKMLWTYRVENAWHYERYLHKHLEDYHVHGEWFQISKYHAIHLASKLMGGEFEYFSSKLEDLVPEIKEYLVKSNKNNNLDT